MYRTLCGSIKASPLVNLKINFLIKISDRPDVPENLMVFRRSDSCCRESPGCFVFVQLDPPSNIKEDDVLHYILDHKLGSATITSTTYEFLIPNCTIDLDIKVRAVSRCDSMGTSKTERVPPLPANNSAVVPEAMNQGISTR